jgi:hypothetical protein
MKAHELFIKEIVVDKVIEEFGKDKTFAEKLWSKYGKNITEAVLDVIDVELEYLCNEAHELSKE